MSSLLNHMTRRPLWFTTNQSETESLSMPQGQGQHNSRKRKHSMTPTEQEDDDDTIKIEEEELDIGVDDIKDAGSQVDIGPDYEDTEIIPEDVGVDGEEPQFADFEAEAYEMGVLPKPVEQDEEFIGFSVLENVPAIQQDEVVVLPPRLPRQIIPPKTGLSDFVIYCCYPGCPNHSETKNITIFPLPTTRNLYKLWCSRLNFRTSFDSYKERHANQTSYGVCHNHFERNSLERVTGWRLKSKSELPLWRSVVANEWAHDEFTQTPIAETEALKEEIRVLTKNSQIYNDLLKESMSKVATMRENLQHANATNKALEIKLAKLKSLDENTGDGNSSDTDGSECCIIESTTPSPRLPENPNKIKARHGPKIWEKVKLSSKERGDETASHSLSKTINNKPISSPSSGTSKSDDNFTTDAEDDVDDDDDDGDVNQGDDGDSDGLEIIEIIQPTQTVSPEVIEDHTTLGQEKS